MLTGALAADAESRRRFEHEAIAALNDPHICTIHHIGRHGELDYLVLEHLDGETLAARLSRAQALSIDEALAIAIQIGDALGRAHRAGIVHRDLKPGNVMLVNRGGKSSTPNVKLLDFGLASRTTVARPPALDASVLATTPPSLAATQSSAVTDPAIGFGTVQYMSPEQLDGQAGDHRADIFAFGCVLYEMLAARKAFEGASAITVIAAIMSSEPPPVPALQSQPLLDHLLRRCLEKDPDRRWQGIGDVTGELRWIASRPAIAPAPALRFDVTTAPTDDPSTALSPDGTELAFVANQDRVPVLWVRPLDSTASRALPGTESASFPFWSPDGRTLGYFSNSKLKRVDIAGGMPLVIADAPNARGGAWNADGVILFAPGVNAPIMRVSTRGGSVEPVTQLNAGSGPAHRWPQFLPDGKRFLFSSTLGTAETNGVYLGSLDRTPPVRVLASDGAAARFVAPDRLLAITQGALQAYHFNPGSGAVPGEPTVIAQGFAVGAASGVFAASSTGVLAYRTSTAQRRQLVWVNRQGAMLRAVGEPETDAIASPELSADEQSVLVFLTRTGDNDIWTIELARNLARRITDGRPADAHPLWDPDGQHVVFTSQRFGRSGPARQAVIGGKAEPLFANNESGVAVSWTRDRQYILLLRSSPQGAADLVAVTAQGEPREVVVAQSPSDETEGQFAPDGRWMAFVSNETGRPEVFVQSFPEARARAQVSTAGGSQVRWSADGKEIYYVATDGRMMAVSIGLGGASPDVKAPVPLFPTHLATGVNVLGNKPQYAVSRDGRFLLNTSIESPSSPVVVLVNWMERLKL